MEEEVTSPLPSQILQPECCQGGGLVHSPQFGGADLGLEVREAKRAQTGGLAFFSLHRQCP